MSTQELDLRAVAPSVTDYTDGRRRVRFVAMQHVAMPVFYAAAKDVLRAAQAEGYVHFYEFVDMYALDDTGQRKVRKLTQILPMPGPYGQVAAAIGAQLGIELEAQQFDELIGLGGGDDVGVDLTPQEFLRRVEEAIGPIPLSEEDLATPLDQPVSVGIPPEEWTPVVLGSRNVHLAEAVLGSPHERIVISYGAAHEPGWLAEMRARDPRWAPVVT